MALAASTVWWLFRKPLDLSIVLANLTMAPLEFRQPQMMGHYWTLEVELIFYALVLILFWTKRLHSESTIAWWLLALAIAWNLVSRNHFGYLFLSHNLAWSFLGYFITVMFWGAMMRKRRSHSVENGLRGCSANWPFVLVTALVFGRPLIAILFGSETVNREDWRGTLAGLILFIIATRIPDRFAAPFMWLGTISYSLYLLHPAVFYPLFYLVREHPSWRDHALGWYVAISMAASIVAALTAYWVIERPSNALGRWLVARRKARQTSTLPSSLPEEPARSMPP